MILFGHLGITTGIVRAYEKAAYKDKSLIDYRVVLVGSVLPDMIDKPIGAFLFRSTFHNSRIFAHSLLFVSLLLFAGVYWLYKNKRNNILILGICSFLHLVLDSMWLYPKILLWPCFGWRFPARPEGSWIHDGLIRLITDPGYYLPELMGFLIIAYFFIRLLKGKGLKAFLAQGKL